MSFVLAGGLILQLHLGDPQFCGGEEQGLGKAVVHLLCLYRVGVLESDAVMTSLTTELRSEGNGAAGKAPKALFVSWPFHSVAALSPKPDEQWLHLHSALVALRICF